MQLLLVIPVIIFGCNGIDEQEAELVFHALYEPLHDIRDETIGITTGEINIEQTQGSSWEGSVSAKGTYKKDNLIHNYTLKITLGDTYVLEQDVTLDGEFSLGITYAIDQTDGQSYDLQSQVLGEVSVSGDASGTAELDYYFNEDYDHSSTLKTPSSSGTISNTDVSGFQ